MKNGQFNINEEYMVIMNEYHEVMDEMKETNVLSTPSRKMANQIVDELNQYETNEDKTEIYLTNLSDWVEFLLESLGYSFQFDYDSDKVFFTYERHQHVVWVSSNDEVEDNDTED